MPNFACDFQAVLVQEGDVPCLPLGGCQDLPPPLLLELLGRPLKIHLNDRQVVLAELVELTLGVQEVPDAVDGGDVGVLCLLQVVLGLLEALVDEVVPELLGEEVLLVLGVVLNVEEAEQGPWCPRWSIP